MADYNSLLSKFKNLNKCQLSYFNGYVILMILNDNSIYFLQANYAIINHYQKLRLFTPFFRYDVA